MKLSLAYCLGSLRLVGIVLICIYLGACATGVNMVPAYTEDTLVTPSQGFVVARVVNAGSIALPLNQLTIVPKNLNESEETEYVRLLSVKQVPGESSLFVSAVDAGQYSLSSARSYHSGGDRWYDKWVGADIKFGTFEVRPGEVTDLGTLIYYSKSEGDKYRDILLRSTSLNDGSIIKSFLPYFNKIENESFHWDDDGFDSDRHALFTSTVQNPNSFNEIYRAPDDSLYFLGKLGFIVKRGPDEVWSQDAVDTDFDLTAAAQNERGDLIVGGDFGTIFVKTGGGAWKDISVSTKFRVEHILVQDSNTIDIILRSARTVEIYRGHPFSKDPQWKRMAEFYPYLGWLNQDKKVLSVGLPRKKNRKTNFVKLISSVSFRQAGESSFLFVNYQNGLDYSIFNGSTSLQFKVNPANWSISDADGVAENIDVSINAGAIDIGLQKPGFFSLGGYKYYRYDDANDSWKQITMYIDNCVGLPDRVSKCSLDGVVYNRKIEFRFVATPVFSDPLNGTAFVEDIKYGENKETLIVVTNDGGKSWIKTDHKVPKKYCRAIVPEAFETLLVSCNGASSDFYQSEDGGETWSHVREHANF